MGDTKKNIGEIYVERAMRPEPFDTSAKAGYPSNAVLPPVQSSDPVIYGGTTPGRSIQDEYARQPFAARNNAVRRRKVSPFNLMLALIAAAIAIVLYIGNVIAVQQLLGEVNNQQATLRKILDDQELLKAQINRMSSLERIRKMAEDDLGLRNPKEAPQWLEVDGDKIQKIQSELSSQPGTQKNK